VQGIPVLQLGPGNGLVGAPTLDNEGILSASLKLRPHVFPGSLVEVKSEFVSGTFKVIRADYSGSVFGDDFNIDIEGKELT